MADSADWKYPLFISYSSLDQRRTKYPAALKEFFDSRLDATLRTTKGLAHLADRRVFFDKTGLPKTGEVSTELKRAVNESFALMIVVDKGYIESEWCLHELRSFMGNFVGLPDELHRRLFIVVTDAESQVQLTQDRRWPTGLILSSIHSQFYSTQGRMPLTVLTPEVPGEEQYAVTNPALERKLEGLLDRLVTEIGESGARKLVSLPVARRTASRRIMLGTTTADIAPQKDELISRLQNSGIDVDEIDVADLVRGVDDKLRARAEACALFVQPYSESIPLLPHDPAGHLRIMGEQLSSVLPVKWWRVSHSNGAAVPHDSSLQRYRSVFDQLRKVAEDGSVADLVERISRQLDVAAADCAVVFIDSSSERPGLWKKVGNELSDAWRRESGELPLLCMALPFQGQRTEELEVLPEGHAVVLLFENRNLRALVSKATLVETVLFKARRTPTRFVAWFPKQKPDIPHADYVYNTVAFLDVSEGRAPVIEPAKLQQLLQEVARQAKERGQRGH